MMKIFNKISVIVDNIIRNREEKKREEIAKNYESTVKFLMSRNKDGKNGLNWLDQIKYLNRNPFVDIIEDKPSMFTKGREHRITIRLVQSNYRIKRSGELFILKDTDISRCKAYTFSYLYYNNNDTPDNQIRLHYIGFSIESTYHTDWKLYQVLNV